MSFEFFIEDSVRSKFGFPDNSVPEKHEEDEFPIKLFNQQEVLHSLSDHKIGKLAGRLLIGGVQWGNDSGAIKVSIDGNFKVLIQRKTETLEGDSIWVLCKYFKIKISEFAGKEDKVIMDICSEIDELATQSVPAAKSEFSVDSVARKIVYRLNENNNIFKYEKTVSLGKNKKIIQFGLTSSGVGKLMKGLDYGHDSNLAPIATIDLDFSEKTGVLHAIFTTVAMDEDSNQWYIDVPYLDAFFVGTQKTTMIADLLCSVIKLI